MLKKIPIPICGLALSYAVLGNLLANYSAVARTFCGFVSLFLILLFIAKVLSDMPGFRKECQQAPLLSILPTFSMTIVILSTYLKSFHAPTALVFWVVGLCLHFFILLVFSRKFLHPLNLQTVLPSWFIVYVGFVTGSVSAPAMGQKGIGLILLALGVFFYVAVFILVVYRIIKIGKLPPPLSPTLSIFTAPVGLCLAGYLSVVSSPSPFWTPLLFIFLVVNYCFALQNAFRLVFSTFYPSFSSFTFPLVISTLAFKMMVGANAAFKTNIILLLLNVMIFLAIFFVSIVSIRYVRTYGRITN